MVPVRHQGGGGEAAGNEVVVGVVPELARPDRGPPETITSASPAGSCRISPGVSRGRGVSCSETVMCESQAESRRPERLRWALSCVEVPSVSERRLAVRSSLGVKATRTWQLSRME